MYTLDDTPSLSRLTRRDVLLGACASAAAVSLCSVSWAAGAEGKLSAVVIGDTRRGEYGHGLDVMLANRQDVQIVAVADPDEAGRAAAVERTRAQRSYADYREMLAKEKPQIAIIGPRWTDQHHAMAMAAIEAGAHVICEKPFMTTLAEADEVLAAAERTGRKVAVMHQFRLAPSVLELKKRIEQDDLIGDLLHLTAWGKQDSRAGGEDMLVLGTHLFDLMRLFAGDAQSCTARVLQDGKPITAADARQPGEQIGLVAGNEIYAQFAFADGVNASFHSRQGLREQVGVWGLELIGSKTKARLVLTRPHPAVYIQEQGMWGPEGRLDPWKRMEGDPSVRLDDEGLGFGPANQRIVDDFLDAIGSNRQPASSGENGAKAIEMVYAVYRAALNDIRVELPLKERGHPLQG